MLYLTQLTLDGEPIGVYSANGESFISQGRESFARKVGPVSEDQWPQFVEDKTRSFNHRFLWGSVDDARTDLEDILFDLQVKHRDG